MLLTLAIASVALLPAGRPNIILIVGDDVGYGELQSYNPLSITPTPRLDQLAGEGIRMTNAHVTHPICGPSRVSLMMGKNSSQFGIDMNGGGLAFGVPKAQNLLSEYLHDAGYATGAIGKWHLGGQPYNRPNARGFDEFFGFIGGGDSYYPDSPKRANSPILRNNTEVYEPEYLTHAFRREAIDFIHRHASGVEPFFLYLPFNAIHTPFQATPEDLSLFDDVTSKHRRYLSAMLKSQDEAVGEVMDTLNQEGIRNNTLVIYLSDNGGERAAHVDNRPLRGSKFTIFEGGLRVPFMLSWPSQWWAHPTVTNQLISSLDIVPTILDAAGIALPPRLDGQDIRTVLELGPRNSPLFFRYGLEWTVIDGPWKRFQQLDPETFELKRVLYNLDSDIGETTDIAAAYPQRAAAMDKTFRDWSAEFTPPLWGPIINPNATSLALYHNYETKTCKAVLLDFKGEILASRDLREYPGFLNAKIGRCRTNYDFDLVTIQGSEIKIRSMNFSGGEIITRALPLQNSVEILGFADFNRNGVPEIVSRASDGQFRTDEINPVKAFAAGSSIELDVDLSEFHRVLGFADMGGPDTGPDMIVANDNDNVMLVYLKGNRAFRFSNYMFRPRADDVTVTLPRQYIGALDVNGDGYADLFNSAQGVQSSIWFTDRLRSKVLCKYVQLDPNWRAISIGSADLPVPGSE
jgi:arylsulfatase A-like enzyme